MTRFVDNEDRASSYRSLFGRDGVLEKIRSLPKGTGAREDAAVREYCKSLRDICRFRHVSQAVVLNTTKEQVRYYLVFATNSLRGIDVFKRAETQAARTQDQLRYESKIKKTSQPSLLFEGGPPKSRKSLELSERYLTRAHQKIIRTLASSQRSTLPYADLYGKAMAFPLVTPNDLETWLEEMIPHVEIHKNSRREKLDPFKTHSIKVLNRDALRSLLT